MRRSKLFNIALPFSILMVALVLFVPVQIGMARELGPAATTDNWTQFGFTASHTRFNNKETILSPSNVSQLTQAWSKALGGSNSVSSPAIVGGKVYTTNSAVLYALNASTGKIIWSVNTNEPLALPSPAVANNIVYIGGTSVNAYNASNGSLLWQKTFSAEVPDSSPTILNGVVYIGGLDGQVLALNASTGATLWYANTGGSYNYSPAVVNGILYGDTYSGTVYALNASGCSTPPCQPIWTATTANLIYYNAEPLVANNTVYVTCTDDNLYAFNASNGKRLWTAKTGAEITASPAYANGVVYVGSTDNHLYAFNAKTGATIWSVGESNQFVASPAVANGVVFDGDLNGNIYAFNAATGATLWSAATGTANLTQVFSPSIANGVLYVSSSITGSGTEVTAFKLPA